MNDDFLKSIAKEYAKETGLHYAKENATIPNTPTPTMDAKFKRAFKKSAPKYWWVGVAASIIIVAALLPNLLQNNQASLESAPITEAYEMEAVAEAVRESDVSTGAAVASAPTHVHLTAPPGWEIYDSHQDGDMSIFHLRNQENARVVVTTTPPPPNRNFDAFIPVRINDTPGFMQVAGTHSVLIFDRDGMEFTLTTPYDYNDLLFLGESWLRG